MQEAVDHPRVSSGQRRAAKALVPLLSTFLLGVVAATYLHWPALTNEGIYKADIKQSPHWAAYHTTSFRADDMILDYARFNESPLQNAIYFVATLVFDYVASTKYLAVASYGFASALFFVVGRVLYNVRTGLLMSLFFTFFPDNFEYSCGFFSKFWMIPVLLVGLFLLDKQRWRGLLLLMPFAALAYPMTSLLLGMTCGIYLVMLFFEDRRKARALFVSLAGGSILALLILSVKYVDPPEFIGPMNSRQTLVTMPEMIDSRYWPIPPLHESLLEHVGHPFVIVATVGYLLVLGWRGVRWSKTWVALLLASVIGYVAADWFYLRLYFPNRYTRYSLALLLILWHATNWDLILARIPRPAWRNAAFALLLIAAGIAYRDTFEQGKDTADKTALLPLCDFVATLPEGILLAGPTVYLDDVMIHSRRSILASRRLDHMWFSTYHEEIRKRTLAIFEALYASDVETVNELHSRYGVTHLVVIPNFYFGRLATGNFGTRYDDYIRTHFARPGRRFLLANPPPQAVLYEDGRHTVLRLPLPGSSTNDG